MFHLAGTAISVCTVRRHPTGGFTPVLHVSNEPAPEPTEECISLPTPADAATYARYHYGIVPIVVDEECARRTRTAV